MAYSKELEQNYKEMQGLRQALYTLISTMESVWS